MGNFMGICNFLGILEAIEPSGRPLAETKLPRNTAQSGELSALEQVTIKSKEAE